MSWGDVWTAVGVVCGAEAVVFGAIVALMGREIRDLRQQNKESQATITALRHDVSDLKKEQTDYLLRLVAAEKRVGDAERERNSAEQELRNLQYLHDRLHGGGKK